MATRRLSLRGQLLRLALLATLGVIALLSLYGWLALSWDYSDGERAGLLQKFSRRGWLCKTHEGELAMYLVAGVQPEIWNFTVRDPVVARDLNDRVGQRVRLHYTEHRGVPSSCFGDTGYFVDRIDAIGEPLPAPLNAPPAAPAAAPASPAR